MQLFSLFLARVSITATGLWRAWRENCHLRASCGGESVVSWNVKFFGVCLFIATLL